MYCQHSVLQLLYQQIRSLVSHKYISHLFKKKRSSPTPPHDVHTFRKRQKAASYPEYLFKIYKPYQMKKSVREYREDRQFPPPL